MMPRNNPCSANQTPRKPLMAIYVAFNLLACFVAMSVVAVNDARAQDEAGEIRIRSERVPAENAPAARRPTDSDHQATHGRIELQGGSVEPVAPASTNQQSENADQLQGNISTPSGDRAHPETDGGNKKARPRPNPNYAGTSIGAAGAKSAPVLEEKKHSINKRGDVTKARHVKSVVKHGDSPELQAYNEKRRKIKEHFKTLLENREERKAKKTDAQSPAEGGSK